ncbi:unnamed protein product [Gordionus sp. m RMFG-2023]|uniref:uncharacterized protein LOC135931099 n=1 Tax=Gordionus sp. m RMFG-2023 TaxID=3053472 RepID=UPI0030DE2DCA
MDSYNFRHKNFNNSIVPKSCKNIKFTSNTYKLNNKNNLTNNYGDITIYNFIEKDLYGNEIGDLPIKYHIKNILSNELPVIGVYIDPKVLPGFKYKVRYIKEDDNNQTGGLYLFNGKARYLLSLGSGYAKRLTFQGATLNNNKNYFWSDSNQPYGFALSLDTINIGQNYVIHSSLTKSTLIDCYNDKNIENARPFYDPDLNSQFRGLNIPSNLLDERDIIAHHNPVGHASITNIYPIEFNEIKTMVIPITAKGNCKSFKIEKYVYVKFDSTITFSRPILDFPLRESEYSLEGIAVIVKENGKNSNFAETWKIFNVVLPYLGNCTFARA